MEWQRGRAYGPELRGRVLGPEMTGLPSRAVAERFKVSPSYVIKARQRLERTGETEARRSRGRPPSKVAIWAPVLAARVAAEPDATLNELRLWLLAEHGAEVGLMTVWRALRRSDLTRKKTTSCGRAGTA